MVKRKLTVGKISLSWIILVATSMSTLVWRRMTEKCSLHCHYISNTAIGLVMVNSSPLMEVFKVMDQFELHSKILELTQTNNFTTALSKMFDKISNARSTEFVNGSLYWESTSRNGITVITQLFWLFMLRLVCTIIL